MGGPSSADEIGAYGDREVAAPLADEGVEIRREQMRVGRHVLVLTSVLGCVLDRVLDSWAGQDREGAAHADAQLGATVQEREPSGVGFQEVAEPGA